VFKQIYMAISLESSAVGLLFLRSQDMWFAIPYFILHGAASGLIAIAAWTIFGRSFEDSARWPLALFFSLAFFIPIFGLIGFLIGLTIALWMPRMTMHMPYSSVPIPQFSQSRSSKPPEFRSTSVRVDVAERSAPEEVRLKALLSIQEMPARTTSGLLRDLLADHSDDIRLLSYGMLRNKERAISERVAQSMDAFKAATTSGVKLQAAKELAELNWELVYQDLVVGDMRMHALKQGLLYIGEAVRLSDDDAGLWFLGSRLAHRALEHRLAVLYMRKALKHGYPRTLAIAEMAELAFSMRDFAAVRMLEQEFPDVHRVPQLAPVSNYWKSSHE
jgi:polysaccharide biosynthesis protein PelE